MSSRNGDKSRSGIERKKRIRQRMKDRAAKAAVAPTKPAAKSEKKATPAS